MSNGSIFLAKKMCTDSLEALKAFGDPTILANSGFGVWGGLGGNFYSTFY